MVVLVVSKSLPQRRGSFTGVLFVESWHNGALPIAQRRATVAESALRHYLASADVDVDGVTGVPWVFPQGGCRSKSTRVERPTTMSDEVYDTIDKEASQLASRGNSLRPTIAGLVFR